MLSIRGVIFESNDLRRPTRESCFRLPYRQDRCHLRPLLEPSLNALGLRTRDRLEVDLSDQSLIQPRRKSFAESVNHCSDADICRESKQKCHEGERKTGKLLSAVSPEPLSDRPVCVFLTQSQNASEHKWE